MNWFATVLLIAYGNSIETTGEVSEALSNRKFESSLSCLSESNLKPKVEFRFKNKTDGTLLYEIPFALDSGTLNQPILSVFEKSAYTQIERKETTILDDDKRAKFIGGRCQHCEPTAKYVLIQPNTTHSYHIDVGENYKVKADVSYIIALNYSFLKVFKSIPLDKEEANLEPIFSYDQLEFANNLCKPFVY